MLSTCHRRNKLNDWLLRGWFYFPKLLNCQLGRNWINEEDGRCYWEVNARIFERWFNNSLKREQKHRRAPCTRWENRGWKIYRVTIACYLVKHGNGIEEGKAFIVLCHWRKSSSDDLEKSNAEASICRWRRDQRKAIISQFRQWGVWQFTIRTRDGQRRSQVQSTSFHGWLALIWKWDTLCRGRAKHRYKTIPQITRTRHVLRRGASTDKGRVRSR